MDIPMHEQEVIAESPMRDNSDLYRLMLLDLLAIIHRDGGHTTQELGVKLSWEQAKLISSQRIAALKSHQAETAK